MTDSLPPSQAQTDPGSASAENGLVILDGPDGVAVTMTAEAAAETGQRLISAAELAARQQAGNTDAEAD